MSKEIKLCKVKDYVPIEDLAIHPDNPRHISKERLTDLKHSILTKGFYEPILVWKKNGTILSGNHRYLAVKELISEGYSFNSPEGEGHVLPVVLVNVNEAKARAILFETNNHYAEWVDEKLAEALKEARENGEDTTGYGFTTEYVDVMLKSALTDAEAVVDKTPPTDELVDAEDAIGDSDEFDSVILKKPVYEQVTELLSQIAKGINPEWEHGDSLDEAAQALCQFAREKGVEKLWTKKSTVTRKAGSQAQAENSESPPQLTESELSTRLTRERESFVRSRRPGAKPTKSSKASTV